MLRGLNLNISNIGGDRKGLPTLLMNLTFAWAANGVSSCTVPKKGIIKMNANLSPLTNPNWLPGNVIRNHCLKLLPHLKKWNPTVLKLSSGWYSIRQRNETN